MQDQINEVVKSYNAVSLEDMDSVKLMNRTDTKYVFDINKLPLILEDSKEYYSILEISSERQLEYKTLYFDTDDFRMYTAHQNGKLNRYKVRHREYLISNISFLEVKFKNNKGRTIKKRIKRDKIESEFANKSVEFIKKISSLSPDDLKPKLYSNFKRITLVHKEKKERITLDVNLNFNHFESNETIELPFLGIAEVKQDGYSGSSDLIKILRKNKVYPTGMSKYCIGTILLNKQLKYNNFKSKLLTLNKLSNDCIYNFDNSRI